MTLSKYDKRVFKIVDDIASGRKPSKKKSKFIKKLQALVPGVINDDGYIDIQCIVGKSSRIQKKKDK